MNDKINLSVDKRIELVCSVQTLASYWDDLSVKFFNKKLFDCPYRTGIFDYFNSYKHVILESYNALANNVLNFSAFFNLFLYYSDPPELSNRTKVPEGVLNCFPDKSALHEFTARLKDYAEISKFDVFFNDSGPLYKDLIRSFSGTLNTGNSIDAIENYAGKYNKTYNIIIAPLCLGNYSFKIEDRLFIVFSPVNYGDGQYRFSPPFYNEMLLWHETCHSFVNDLTDNYKTLIEDLKIPDCFKNGVYDNISTVINESLINAICIRLFEINGNIGGSKYLLNDSNNKENIYTDDMVQWLIAYEKNTDLSFSEYYIKYFPLLFDRLKLHNG